MAGGRMDEARGIQQRCTNCGAMLVWHPESQTLRCDSCGAAAAEAPASRDVIEHELEGGLRAKHRGLLAAGTRQAKCTECGAAVEFPDGVTATRCSFCDAPTVLAQTADTGRYLPESLIPFAVGKDASMAQFKGWLRRLWFRPSDLKHKAEVAELRGVYIPYWAFDASVSSSWRADAGYHYYETVSVYDPTQKRHVDKRVQKTRWQPASGHRDDVYDDWLVCASRGVPDGLEAGARDFNTSGLVVWGPQYLAGFAAESYAVDLPEAWERARREITAEQDHRCRRDVPGDTHRFFSARHAIRDVRFKHVLAPLWIAAFRYKDKVYRFLVNGQTGKVAGKAPWSAAKILVAVLLAVAAIAALVWLLGRRG